MRLFVDQFSVQVFIEESRKLQESVFREEHNAILQVFVKLDPEYTILTTEKSTSVLYYSNYSIFHQ